MMKYIDFMNQFWRASSMEYMSVSEVALYAFLANECNQNHWNMPVSCSSVRISEVLQISKQTLCTARKNLAKRGLISFIEGKSRHVPSKYSLLKWTDNLTADFTVDLTHNYNIDIDKDNIIEKAIKNFSNKERERNNEKYSQNRRRGIKEISSTAPSYEGAF